MLLNGKKPNLISLEWELNKAGVATNKLGTSGTPPGDPNGEEIFTYAPDSSALNLPTEAAPVVAAHDPSPLTMTITPNSAAVNGVVTVTVTVPTSFADAVVTIDGVDIAPINGVATYHAAWTSPGDKTMAAVTAHYGSVTGTVTVQ